MTGASRLLSLLTLPNGRVCPTGNSLYTSILLATYFNYFYAEMAFQISSNQPHAALHVHHGNQHTMRLVITAVGSRRRPTDGSRSYWPWCLGDSCGISSSTKYLLLLQHLQLPTCNIILLVLIFIAVKLKAFHWFLIKSAGPPIVYEMWLCGLFTYIIHGRCPSDHSNLDTYISCNNN